MVFLEILASANYRWVFAQTVTYVYSRMRPGSEGLNLLWQPTILPVRPGKVDLQFIVRAFPKMHAGGRSFFIFRISFGPVHVATETII